MDLDIKVLFGAIAVIIAFVSYVPYLTGIFKGTIKPHAFSWIIWGLLTLIAFYAQVTDGGGAGAWVTGFTASVSFIIVISALKNGRGDITKSDWWSFAGALLSIPLWYFTGDPVWSVILITVIDALAFYPTFRKGYLKPYEDSVLTFGLSATKFVFAIFALSNYSVVTVLYPLSLVVMNGVFVLMLIYQRKKLATS